MSFEELLKLLGLAATDEKAVKLKSFIDDAAKKQERKITELTRKNTELTEKAKAVEALQDKLHIFTDRLELDAEAEELENALEEALKKLSEGGQASDAEVTQLKKELSKLKRDYAKETAAKEELTKNLGDMKGKYQSGLITRALQAELVKGNAISPDMLVKLLKDQVRVGDDDSLVFVNDSGDELEVADGVAEFLKGHTEFVKSSNKPGAGGSGGSGSGGANVPDVVANIIKNRTDAAAADNILSKYFPSNH